MLETKDWVSKYLTVIDNHIINSEGQKIAIKDLIAGKRKWTTLTTSDARLIRQDENNIILYSGNKGPEDAVGKLLICTHGRKGKLQVNFEEVIDNKKCDNFTHNLIFANREWIIYPDVEKPNVLLARNLKHTTIKRSFHMNDKITAISHITANVFLITMEPNSRHELLRIDKEFFGDDES